jgi:hypothetical protein
MSLAASSTGAADGGLRPGTPGPIVPVSARELSVLVRRAVGSGRRRAVWTHLGNEAAVRLDGARASVADGIVLVGLTLDTLETGPQELTTVFAVGSRAKPAGLLAVAEDRPRGHGDLAATFAEPVIATAWRALLTVVREIAASVGRDALGDPLVPVAIAALPDSLHVHTIADHRIGGKAATIGRKPTAIGGRRTASPRGRA